MARLIGPSCKLCRQERMKLFLKGKRCYSEKCSLARKDYRPGEHGKVPKKLSAYGLQLREKQKVKKIYGILEKQFRKYFAEAKRAKGMTGENLLLFLEKRLDNIVFRLNFSLTRASARQLVRHGHFLVNGRKVNIPAYSCKVGDEISLKASSREIVGIKEAIRLSQDREKAPWLEVDQENFKGKVVRLPKKEEIALPIQEQLIVEYYSR
jgi:small subunit ribosomal protein S4